VLGQAPAEGRAQAGPTQHLAQTGPLQFVARRTDLLVLGGVFVAVALYLAYFIPTILVWPPVNGDEGRELNAFWVASGIDPSARNLDPTYGHDPLYKGGLQGWTSALSFRLFGLSVWSGRIVSMLWGAVLLVGVFLLGRKLFGTMAGIIGMALVAMSQPFLVSTHIVRPDIVVAALVVFALYLAESGVRRGAWQLHLLAGLLLGLSFDVHPNTVAFIPMVGLVYLIRYGKDVVSSRPAWLFLAGIGLGALIYIGYRVLPDPKHYFDAFSYWVGVDKRPPSLRTPGQMLQSEVSRFTSYFEGRSIEIAVVALGLLGAIVRLVLKKSPEPLFPGLVIAFAIFTVLVSSKTEYYMVLFYPALLLLVARELSGIPWPRAWIGVIGSLVILWVLVSPMGFDDNVQDILDAEVDFQDRDYFALIDEIRHDIPSGASILAPPVYWPGLWDHPYTDVFVWERVRAERNISFAEFARGINPDYVVLDVKARYEVFRDSPRFMDEYAQLVSTIRHVGYGRVEIWKKRASA
jgi:4-amino-4-deoxy-L-arabinose transferase-like glycosyltransferase